MREAFIDNLDTNRVLIEKMTGRDPHHFCYPSGYYNRESVRWLREYGIESATATGVAALGCRQSHRRPYRAARHFHVTHRLLDARRYRRAAEHLAGRGIARAHILMVPPGLPAVTCTPRAYAPPLQALLAGIGFKMAAVPSAGLLAFIVLLLSIVQIGAFLVILPVIMEA